MVYIFRSYVLCHMLTDFTDKALQYLWTFMSLTFASSAQYTKTPFYSRCIGFSYIVNQLVEDTIILCSVIACWIRLVFEGK